MKGKITSDGQLEINGMDKYCPFTENKTDGYYASCGDWCPLFGEPGYHYDEEGRHDGMGLTIHCGAGRTFTFDEFTDERG